MNRKSSRLLKMHAISIVLYCEGFIFIRIDPTYTRHKIVSNMARLQKILFVDRAH